MTSDTQNSPTDFPKTFCFFLIWSKCSGGINFTIIHVRSWMGWVWMSDRPKNVRNEDIPCKAGSKAATSVVEHPCCFDLGWTDSALGTWSCQLAIGDCFIFNLQEEWASITEGSGMALSMCLARPVKMTEVAVNDMAKDNVVDLSSNAGKLSHQNVRTKRD